MTVAYDAFSSANDAGGASNLAWTHTPVGTPRGVLVWIVMTAYTPSGTNAVSCTYGGVDMGSPVEVIKTTGEVGSVCFYFLGSSIPTGAQTVTFDKLASCTAFGGCISLTGAANTEIVDSDNTINSDAAVNPSVTLSLSGRTCFAGIGFFSGQGADTGVTPLSSWTSRAEHDFTPSVAGVYSYDTIGSSDVTAGWTQTSDDAFAVAVAVSEVAAGGGTALITSTLML
jgi:hypothetical protein